MYLYQQYLQFAQAKTHKPKMPKCYEIKTTNKLFETFFSKISIIKQNIRNFVKNLSHLLG